MAMAAYADAYKQTLRETDDPRAMERRVFGQITAELEAAAALTDGPARLKALSEAVGRNQKLWMTVFFDVSDPGNQLPKALRAQLISFAMFVDRHSAGVLANRADVRPLIELNRRIIFGLAGLRPEDAATPPPSVNAGGGHGAAHPA